MNSTLRKLLSGVLLTFSLIGQTLFAAPQGEAEARLMARGWLRVAQRAPLHEQLGSEPDEALPITVDGKTVGYLFALSPRGFIVTSADDAVEPVIAFSRTGRDAMASGSPLAALLRGDLPQRLAAAPSVLGLLSLQQAPEAALKWAAFTDSAADSGEISTLSNNGLGTTPADLRVAPLITSRWGQESIGDQACYNYYTPNNDPCGCIGTSWGQLMRFHSYPANGIGAITRTIKVDGVPRSATTRGGNGSGGPYAWTEMPLVPSGSMTLTQRQAIGSLVYDIVVAVSTTSDGLLSDYTADSTVAYMPPYIMSTVFGYASTFRFDASVSRTNAINANLDAGFPVVISLPDHSVACDGYGFQSGTAYHHLNMGWDGQEDAWYALDTINAGGRSYTGINYVYANIFPSGTGEIISGRVLSSGGTPIANATVALSQGSRTNFTDGAGIYSFSGVTSGSSVTLTAAKSGYSFAAKNVTLGTSANYTSTCGNRGGNDFAGTLSVSYRLISGRIINSASNGLADVEVVFSGGGGSTYTDGGGNYTLALPVGWSGTVAPSASVAYFEPASYTVTNLQSDTTGLVFLGTYMCFVKPTATGANNGTSWASAYTNLVTALGSTPTDVEIWVAAGTYKPGTTRDSSFFFIPGQAAYGGFIGTETRRDQRDWRMNPTLLSGDIGVPNTVTDNCYNVVRGAANARVDGFTITGGNASYLISGSGTIDELAHGLGGGVFVWSYNAVPSASESSSFLVDHCLVTNNRALRTEGPGTQGQGGGLYGCLVRNSVIHSNEANAGGGATLCRLEASTVVSNSASDAASGALWVSAHNAIIYYNMYYSMPDNYYASDSSMTNTCTTPAFPGTGNLTSAPLFVNTPAGNFMIATNSPCKNAGAVLSWMTGAKDLFGDSRASGAAPDMGAYELQATHPAYGQLPASPLRAASTFTVSVQTRYGWSYRLQYRASLAAGSWQNVSGAAATAVGDGTVKTLYDAAPPAGRCFYQVLAQ